jgi:nitrous oxide reductase accessory protein NosL
VLKTLHGAGHYSTALPFAMQQRAEWQTAAKIMAANGQRLVIFAEIPMRQALHAVKPASPPVPRPKPTKKYKIAR